MSEPPARAPDDGGEWRPLADQVAVNVKNFIDGVEALAQSGGDETVPLLLLEVSQIRLSAVDEYAEVFDPYKDTSCLPFRISDDIAAVVADLIHGLKHYQAGRSLE